MKVILMQTDYIDGKEITKENVTNIEADVANVKLVIDGKTEYFLNTIIKEVMEEK